MPTCFPALRMRLLASGMLLLSPISACDDSGTNPYPSARYRLVSISGRPVPALYYLGGAYVTYADSGYLRFASDSMVEWITYRSIVWNAYPNEPEPQLGSEVVHYRREGDRILIARSDTSWDTVVVRGGELTAHFRHEGIHDLGYWLFRQ